MPSNVAQNYQLTAQDQMQMEAAFQADVIGGVEQMAL